MPNRAAVIATQNQLLEWLRDVALTVWDEHGVDRSSGGYFEELAFIERQRAYEASGAVRRGRVVARQIFVFDVARRLGWQSPMGNPVAHGGDYLFSRLHRGDGYFHTAVDATTHRAQMPFSLYEQAFYLFALARLNATLGSRYPVVDTAVQCLARLRRDYGRSEGGFEESSPPILPLKSNPHMHLLEAALEWIGVSTGDLQQHWIELAGEIVGLCLSRFCDPVSGAIREYFDHQWRPLAGDAGRVVEPGHQFEWAWLLLQWSGLACCSVAERRACTVAAVRLIEIGEKWGVDPARGVAINQIWDDMSPKHATAKLWPQTERVKAWCAMMPPTRLTPSVPAQRSSLRPLGCQSACAGTLPASGMRRSWRMARWRLAPAKRAVFIMWCLPSTSSGRRRARAPRSYCNRRRHRYRQMKTVYDRH